MTVVTAPAPRRFVGSPPFWLGLVGMFLAVPAGFVLLQGPRQPLPVYATLPSVALVDQDARPFAPSQLRGKAWVANFIFTSCPSVCPLLTRKLAGLEQRSRDLGDRIHFVSFSVDPQTDTPAVLKSYGQKYGQEPGRWTLVTGSVEAIGAAVVQGFKIAIDRQAKPGAAPDLYEIVHGEHFVLVDQAGRIRGYYRNEDAEHERLLKDLARLAGEGSS